ncbi:MAG: tetratricopeptide repeat protein [Alphaproteobacteria bacterium]|nr:tetratricopeptide repeat protein [Alphaproteobacteria bacterium]
MKKMQKRIGFLFVVAASALSACVYFANKDAASPSSALPTLDAEEAVAEQESWFADRELRDIPADAAFGAYLVSQFAQASRDYGAAAKAAAQALEKDPTHPDLINQTYLLYVLAGQLPEALPYAQKALDADPANLLPRLALFTDLVKKNKYDQAAQLMSVEQREGYTVLLAPLVKSWLLVGQNKMQEALDSLKDLEGNKDLAALYLFNRALIFEYFHKLPQAKEAYDNLFAEIKSRRLLRAMLAMNRFFSENRFMPADNAFFTLYQQMQAESFSGREIMSSDLSSLRVDTPQKGLALVFNDFSQLLAQMDSSKTALYLAQLAFHLAPDPIMRLYIGELLENAEQFEQANQLYLAGADEKALAFSFQIRRALNLARMKQTQAGIDIMQKLAKEYTRIPIFSLILGDLQAQADDCPSAVASYTNALDVFGNAREPATAVIYFNRGSCYDRLGQTKKALPDLQIALSLAPDNPIYMNYVAYTWAEQNKSLDKALKLAQKAVELAPEDGHILDTLGWVYYRMGQYDKAAKVLEQAVEKVPANAAVNDHLGDVYYKQGRKREARFQWAHARVLPDDSSPALLKKIENKLSGKHLP